MWDNAIQKWNQCCINLCFVLSANILNLELCIVCFFYAVVSINPKTQNVVRNKFHNVIL